MRTKTFYQVALFFLVVAVIMWVLLPITPLIANAGIGNPNYSITTKVNVTNAPPQVTNVVTSTPITLTANATAYTECNATVSDLNGATDMASVNATFFDSVFSQSSAQEDNTTHYSNVSCTNFSDVDSITRLYSCGFNINYNANPGNWTCNVTAVDTKNVATADNGTSSINQLIALYVDELLDFGQIGAGNTTNNILFNITNVGNRGMNVSVYTYGRTDNDSLAMVCEFGNISIGNLKVTTQFNISNDTQFLIPFSQMTTVNNSNATSTRIGNLTVLQFNNTYVNSINTTAWRLNVPLQGVPSGVCNGTLVFRASKGV